MAMHAFDEVEYNDIGNGVTLIKQSEFVKEKKRNPLDYKDESFEPSGNRYYIKKRGEIDFEMTLAAELQETFLPDKEELKNFTGVKSAYIFKPLRKVSGDFIDIIWLEENKYGYFISDIAGHGFPAALICAMLKVFFSLYGKDVLSPQLLFELLNDEFFNYLNSGEYFTSFYGIYFAEERKFVYTNANHPAPLLLRVKTGEIVSLNTEGFFVGVSKESKFEEEEVFLEKGDRILFFTDGIVEAKSSEGKGFGEERLKEMYRKGTDTDISELIHNINDAVLDFAKGNINDDMIIAIMEIE
jgi:sigma-B regulation protein RsbU (phosphoserine phosphatase)